MSTPLDQAIESLRDINGYRAGSFAIGVKGIIRFAPNGFQEGEGGALQYFLEALANIARQSVTVLHVNTVTTGNIGPSESDLHSYVLPENKLEFDGQSIETLFSGTFSNS